MFRMLVLVFAFALVPLLAADEQEGDQKKVADQPLLRVKMETTRGDIVLELSGEKAPITVDNFLRYAKDGYYNGTIFHRVISTFMIQGGGFSSEMDEKTEGLRPPIRNEWRNGLKNVRGTIAMARKGWRRGMPPSMKEEAANSATSQFFINVVDNPNLDQAQADGAAYCAFGKVVEGMDVVDAIRNTELTTHPKLARMGKVVPTEPIIIKSVTLLDGLEYPAVFDALEKAKAAAAEAEAAVKAEAEKQAEARAATFKKLLEKGQDEQGNKLQKSPTGLMYVILKEGEGPSPTFVDEKLREKTPTDWLLENKDARRPPDMDKVEVHYTGWLMDGTQFDSSRDRGTPITFPLHGVIKGWFEGVSMMKPGGRRLLIIPPDLAYGKPGRPGIPPNATLIFDVELLGIK